MKRLTSLLAVLLFTACASPSLKDLGSPYSGAEKLARAEKRILITFVDHTAQRFSVGGPGDYRQRGDYPSSTWSRRLAASLAEEYKLQQVAEWLITALEVRCVVYEVLEDRSIEQVLQSLAHDTRVDSVQRMHRFRALSDPYAHWRTGLPAAQMEAAHRWATGRNVTIAMIDTGVDFTHPALVGQISTRQDFIVNDDPDSFFKDIHGTAVAGVIAATDHQAKGVVGVAPGSKLIALKACWPEKPDSVEAVCDTFTLAKALNAAVHLKPPILNLSLTGPYDALLAKLIDKTLAEGMIVVAAKPARSDAHSGFPASMEHVIGVRLARPLLDGSDAVPASDSILAPGSDVLTTFPHGSYNFISGSSLAAAYVSGVVALLFELQPGLPTDRVAKILQTTAAHTESMTPRQSSGVVNACAAIAQLRGTLACF